MSDHRHSIVDSLRGRLDQLTGADVPEDERDDWHPSDGILSIDRRTVTDVLMRCGGPTQFYRIWSADGDVYRVEYHDSWSNGPESVVLTDDEAAAVLDAIAWEG